MSDTYNHTEFYYQSYDTRTESYSNGGRFLAQDRADAIPGDTPDEVYRRLFSRCKSDPPPCVRCAPSVFAHCMDTGNECIGFRRKAQEGRGGPGMRGLLNIAWIAVALMALLICINIVLSIPGIAWRLSRLVI